MEILAALQGVLNLAQGINNTKLTQEIINLQQSVLKVVTENNDFLKSNLKLQAEIEELKKDAEIKEKKIFKEGAYWIDNDGPFCTRCLDADSKLIRGSCHPSTNKMYCPNCKTFWKNDEQLKMRTNYSR